MQDITVDKGELLERLEENRSKHRKVFEAALKGYREKAIEELEYRISRLRKGKLPELHISLTVPQDHTRDYDRVITMVTMHQGESFTLDESSFQSYVMDDWRWKREWVLSNSGYAHEAFAASYGDVVDE